MLSAPFLTLEFDHADGKIDQLGSTCVALSAGDALVADEVLSEGPGFAGQLNSPLIVNFADHIRQKFVESRRRMANEQVLEPRGLTFEQFYQHGGITRLPPDLALLLDSQVQRLQLGVSIILAGVDRAGAHVYTIEDPGMTRCWNRLGYNAIGSGQTHAMLTLVGLSQHLSMGLNETVFSVYAAKRAAEIAPGVGEATEMRIVTAAGVQSVSGAELAMLAPLYEQRTKPKLDELNAAIKNLPFEKAAENDSPKQSAEGATPKRRSAGAGASSGGRAGGNGGAEAKDG